MHRFPRLTVASVLAISLPSFTYAADDVLEEVIVTATLRAQSLVDVPVSVTVLGSQILQDAGQQHFQEVLGLVPNLNWAGGSSRPRYFQIRGIGEREQYEGAPNMSVGFLIDDIDFSGLGMAATLFDVKQVEVLRGPQGTRYGANALAGLIAVRSNDPESKAQFGATAGVGNYDSYSLGAYATAPVEALNSAWRLSVQQYRSDGFMDNTYLGRKDTNDRDELSGRFKWHWQVSDASAVDITLLHANLDNGYDGWAIDNSRTTLSDEPGKDSQRATGTSVRYTSSAWNPYTLTLIGTYVDSDSVNSFDADWGNAQSWRPFTYAYYMRSDRDRTNKSLELRLASAPATEQQIGWLVGAYALRLNEQGNDVLFGAYADPGDAVFRSVDRLGTKYDATNLAVFGQVEGYLAPRWRWSAGLRGEQREADYHDRDPGGASPPSDLNARNQMLGGQLSLTRELSATANAYVSAARGYKAGGFNLGSSVPVAQRYFAPEYLWSVESGLKASLLDNRMFVDAALFYQWRRNLQMRTGEQLDPSNPGTYTFITDNIARGYNTGVEFSARYLLTRGWELGGSLGLLRTRASGAVDEGGEVVPEREQAHAPEYTAALFATWRAAQGWMARVDVQAKDNFYFDVATDHNQQSRAYTIANIKAGYEQATWSAYLWVSNVFDKDYSIRGFYFSNEPPDWPTKLYTQKGDPRQFGVTGNWKF